MRIPNVCRATKPVNASWPAMLSAPMLLDEVQTERPQRIALEAVLSAQARRVQRLQEQVAMLLTRGTGSIASDPAMSSRELVSLRSFGASGDTLRPDGPRVPATRSLSEARSESRSGEFSSLPALLRSFGRHPTP